MKRDDLKSLGSLIDQKVVSIFYDTDKEENIVVLNINCEKESLVIRGNGNFSIEKF